MKQSALINRMTARLRFFLLMLMTACILAVFTACSDTGTAKSVTAVTLPKAAVSLSVGGTYTLYPLAEPATVDAAFSYQSSNTTVATVSADGLVKALSFGTANITVTSGGKAATLVVTVSQDAVSSSSSASSLAASDASWTNKKVSVLMYHSVSKMNGNNLCTPPALFDSEMVWLKNNGYTTLSMDELYTHMSEGAPLPDKVVVITLDDGYADNYTAAYPILKKYGLKATVFMISDKIGTAGYLSASQMKEMSQNNVDIQDHTVTHSYLSQESYSHQVAELTDSKTAIEQITGKTVSYVAYPYGDYDPDTLKAEKTIGYKLAFLEDGGAAKLSDPQLEVPRQYVSAADDLTAFAKLVQS